MLESSLPPQESASNVLQEAPFLLFKWNLQEIVKLVQPKKQCVMEALKLARKLDTGEYQIRLEHLLNVFTHLLVLVWYLLIMILKVHALQDIKAYFAQIVSQDILDLEIINALSALRE